MAIVAGGLGQPEQGAIVAGGFGAAEAAAPGTMAGAAFGAATATGTLSVSEAPPVTPPQTGGGIGGGTTVLFKPRPLPPMDPIPVAMAGAAYGRATAAGTLEAFTDWIAYDDDELLMLLGVTA